jgi:hypothetical protein
MQPVLIAAITLAGLLMSIGRPVVAVAHDFWVEPARFRPVHFPLPVRLMIGDGFPGAAFPRDPTHIREFVIASGASVRSVPGRTGIDPAGYVPDAQPGLHVVAYRSAPRTITLSGEKFDSYVQDEGLDGVVKLRAAAHAPRAPVTEIFSRHARALLLVGDPDAGAADRPLGFTLELVAERNPYALGPGGELPVRLLYHGRPLGDAWVTARQAGSHGETYRLRTDREGRATFRLSHPGMWIIRSLHMIKASPGLEADWESLWASLTFELPG